MASLLLCAAAHAPHMTRAFAPIRSAPRPVAGFVGRGSLRMSTKESSGVKDAVLNDVDGIGVALEQQTEPFAASVVATVIDETASDATAGLEPVAALGAAASYLSSLGEAAAAATTPTAPRTDDDIAQQILNTALMGKGLAAGPILVDGDGANDAPATGSKDGGDDEVIDAAAVVTAVIDSSLQDPASGDPVPISEMLLPESVKEDLVANLNKDSDADAPAVPETAPEPPGLRSILRFAIPAIGVWLCSPILSLIDTSSVGLLSGTAQQAALNPAVAVTDYGCLLVAFMYTATTNLIATAQEKEKSRPPSDKPLTTKTLIASLQLSGLVGTALGSALILFARPLLRSLIGNDSLDPEVFGAAMKYVRIRSLGMPAAVVIGSAQSASLGMQDIKSPLYVLLAAAIVNFLGDVLFVGQSHPLFGGAAGAAWATVFSQYAALGMFLKWFVSKKGQNENKAKKINLTDAIMELTGECEEGKGRRKSFKRALRGRFQKAPQVDNGAEGSRKKPVAFTTRGFLQGKFRKRDLFKLPEVNTAKKFWPFVIPVTTTAVGRVSSYVAMSHVVSSALGTVSMAANQVILSLFYCLTPVADSLNLTAQSFVPGIFAKRRLAGGAESLKKTGRNFIKAGGLFGVAMLAACASIPLFSGFFTSDPVVISQVNAAVPFLAASFAVHGVICAIEGLLLGQKDLGFLGRAYGAYFVGVPYFMLRVKNAALSGARDVGLDSVWKVFMGYQIVRSSLWLVRARYLQKKTEREIAAAAAAAQSQ